MGDEDFGLGDQEEGAGLDAGEEGPKDDDEELREVDLPPLDADEEGELDDADLVEPSFGEGLDATLPRAARAWEAVGAPLDVGETSAVVCADKGAVVAALRAAPSLVRVDLEGACEPLAALSTKRLVASAGMLAIVTDDGRLRASRDGGATFALVEGASDVESVALASGEIWILMRAGRVSRTADLGKTWDAPLGAARALAIAGDGAAVVALVREAGGGTRAIFGASGRSDALPEGSRRRSALTPILSARGARLAVSGEPRGLARASVGRSRVVFNRRHRPRDGDRVPRRPWDAPCGVDRDRR